MSVLISDYLNCLQTNVSLMPIMLNLMFVSRSLLERGVEGESTIHQSPGRGAPGVQEGRVR